VLDLGCGVGRHAVFLAQQGFAVDAFDASSSGLAFAQQLAEETGMKIRFRQGMMTQLPYETGSFDYVLAWNVIHHGDHDVVVQSIAEVTRVLRSGGYFQGTMLSKRNAKYGLGQEVSPNTFVIEGDGEKSHPHFYCTARELLELAAGFEPLILDDVEQVKPGTFHWTFILQKL
jgi:ubiquinone/menaquinone biosynthesis C-methylase UbiE